MSSTLTSKAFAAMAEKVYRRMRVEAVEIEPDMVEFGRQRVATGLVRVTMRGSYWKTESPWKAAPVTPTRRRKKPTPAKTVRSRR